MINHLFGLYLSSSPYDLGEFMGHVFSGGYTFNKAWPTIRSQYGLFEIVGEKFVEVQSSRFRKKVKHWNNKKAQDCYIFLGPVLVDTPQ